MGRLDDRLKRLEAATEEVAWWTLPPGVEPDWPRPLHSWTDAELRAVQAMEIAEYCRQLEEGFEAVDTPEARQRQQEDTWVKQESWHEIRWRVHRIRRRSSGLPAPEDWQAAAARVRLRVQEYLDAHPGFGDEEEAATPEDAWAAYFELIERYRKENEE